ncbi:hypothetical protein [Bosea vaviloviae]|uniref:Uncharacterized protein n=1 Tax=Bosea vaviloviae TaxID=1526658 RepID=A0A0N0MB28_9HYPH|nr:hypothetical protein [Bosea vaviloviae]KPH79355.1 hypothetical protein AE618_18845 [Bosea vaviloviae]
MIRRLARTALASFTAWRHRRRVAKADPEIARLARLASDRAAKHRKAEPIRRELRARVIANLAREQGVTLADRKSS